MHQVKPRAIVDALDRAGVSAPDEALEEGVALGALGDAGKLRVLPRDADAGVPHDERQEAGLTVGEAVVGAGSQANDSNSLAVA
jgi:hypothetical protein